MRIRWWIVGSLLLAGSSSAIVYYVLTSLWPNPDTLAGRPQLLLFIFAFLGSSAGVVPLAAFFNHRFAKPGWVDRDRHRLLRQGVWTGLFIVILMYLQLLRALTWPVALVLTGVLILIEAFFLTRE